MKNIVSPPRYEDIEIDKIPGAWVVTYWLSDDVALRLKVIHTNVEEPDLVVAEVRTKPDDQFQEIHQGWISVHGVTHLDEFPDEWNEMPDTWTREFMAMAQLWARLTEVAEFGSSMADRYASEPQSSRDHFVFPPTAEEMNRKP